MWYSSSCGRIQLQLTLKQAKSASHSGQCDADVQALSEVPAVARQLRKVDAEVLRTELRECGAWDAEELADHDQNIQRLLWIAAGDISERRQYETH